MPNIINQNYFKTKYAEKRARKNKTTALGKCVRVKGDKGVVISYKKKTSTVLLERNLGGGAYQEYETIVYGRPQVIKNKFDNRKSKTNFHRKKRMRVKDQTHKPYKVDYIEGITVPQANRKSDNWWDCGRWDYKV